MLQAAVRCPLYPGGMSMLQAAQSDALCSQVECQCCRLHSQMPFVARWNGLLMLQAAQSDALCSQVIWTVNVAGCSQMPFVAR